MKHIKLIILFILVFVFYNINAQNYNNKAEVLSSGGGKSTGGNYSNFGVLGETFVEHNVTGGNYNTSIGFLYPEYPFTYIKDISDNHRIEIYPNPANETIYIKNTNSEAAKIEICDILGKKVYESKFQPQLNISKLSQGEYVLKVLDKQGNVLKTQKIVKE